MAKDPRLEDVPKNVNEALQDRVIRHSIYLERYKASEVKRINRILNKDILPELTRKIEEQILRIEQRGTDLGKTTLKRLQRLEKFIKKSSKKLSVALKKDLRVNLDELSRDELLWQVGVIREELGFDIELSIPAARTVVAATGATPFVGFTLDQWFETLDNATQRNLTQAVQRGIIEGESTQQVMRRIRGTKALGYTDGVINTTRRQAEAITRSAVNHVTNQARLELFKENEDIIKGLQWIATLDSRTSVICAGLDGKIFDIDKGPRPPAHVNCRSTMSAVLRDAEDLGLKDIPEGTRASINGQVPKSTTYSKWLKGQPVGIQEQVLGKTKAKLFRDGNLSIDKFTNSNLEPLNLEELRKVEKSAFKRAGVDV